MRIGVIGCGSMGRRRIRLLGELGEEDIAVHDLDARRLADAVDAEPFDVVPYWNLADLWSWRPEAVFVCTPPDSHLDYAVQAARAGARAVFVEKPLDIRMPTEEERAALAGVTTMVGCNLRYARHFLELGQAARESSQPFVHLWMAYNHAAAHPDYLTSYLPKTGALFDAAWHLADLLLDWLGPASVTVGHQVPAAILGMPLTDGGGQLTLQHASGLPSMATYSLMSSDYSLGGFVIEGGRILARSYDRVPDPTMFRHETAAFLVAARGEADSPNPVERALSVLRLCLEARARWHAK